MYFSRCARITLKYFSIQFLHTLTPAWFWNKSGRLLAYSTSSYESLMSVRPSPLTKLPSRCLKYLMERQRSHVKCQHLYLLQVVKRLHIDVLWYMHFFLHKRKFSLITKMSELCNTKFHGSCAVLSLTSRSSPVSTRFTIIDRTYVKYFDLVATIT